MQRVIPFILVLTACSHTPSTNTPDPRLASTQRLDAAIRFSWSDQAPVIARQLVGECLERLAALPGVASDRLPVIKVLPAMEQTGGSIDPLLVEKMVELALINSGRARVIAAADLPDDPMRHRLRVQVAGQSLRPDFILTVSVASLAQEQAAVTTLQLIRLASNEKVWVGMHRADTAPRNVASATAH